MEEGTFRSTIDRVRELAMSDSNHVSGSVVSVDKKDNSVTIKDSKGKEMTLVADADTAADVARLKAGDEVKVTYKKSKDQMVATKITTTAPSASRTK